MPRTRRITLALLLVTALAAAAGCSEDKSSTAPPVVSGPTFNLTFPAQGTSQAVTFITVGSWSYRCEPHATGGMTGTVNVEVASPNDSVVVAVGPSDSLVFRPSTVTIKSGGYVRWVNQSTMTNHTVTR